MNFCANNFFYLLEARIYTDGHGDIGFFGTTDSTDSTESMDFLENAEGTDGCGNYGFFFGGGTRRARMTICAICVTPPFKGVCVFTFHISHFHIFRCETYAGSSELDINSPEFDSNSPEFDSNSPEHSMFKSK